MDFHSFRLVSLTLTSVSLFAVDQHSNKLQLFSLRIASPSSTSLNEPTTLNFLPQSTMTWILITTIELEKNLDLDLYLFLDHSNKLFHLDSLVITLDDLIHTNHRRLLQLHALESQSSRFVLIGHVNFTHGFVF